MADWLAGQDRRTGPGFDCEGEPAVAWSLCRDLLGEAALAPVPAMRPDVTDPQQIRAVRIYRALTPPQQATWTRILFRMRDKAPTRQAGYRMGRELGDTPAAARARVDAVLGRRSGGCET